MNDDTFNDWLISLGVDSESVHIPESADSGENIVQQSSQPVVSNELQSLSDEDIMGILEENNFQEPEEAEVVNDYEDDSSKIIDKENDIPESTVSIEPAQEQHTQLLTPNSPTLLIDESTSRFSGTEWYNEIQKQRIILAGIGGIGSWTALQLARMSPENITLYDDDIVESANMSGQLYAAGDIGMSKVDAICRTLTQYTMAQSIYAVTQRFTRESEAGDIMICGFDSMSARKVFFESWLLHVRSKPKEERRKCLYLDGRLSIDTLQVFCITGDDEYACDTYLNRYLFSDSEADATLCSQKQTTYLACMIGSVIVNLFTNFVANSLDPIIPYDLPFFTEYDSQNMLFKTQN